MFLSFSDLQLIKQFRSKSVSSSGDISFFCSCMLMYSIFKATSLPVWLDMIDSSRKKGFYLILGEAKIYPFRIKLSALFTASVFELSSCIVQLRSFKDNVGSNSFFPLLLLTKWGSFNCEDYLSILNLGVSLFILLYL